MTSRLVFSWFAAVFLLLAGCLPESKNPLSTPANSRIDARLVGVFADRSKKSGESSGSWHFNYHTVKSGSDKAAHFSPWLEVMAVGHEGRTGFSIGRYRVLATHLGRHDYLSFVEVREDGSARKGKNYSFARYEVNWRGDVLIWLADNAALAAAVKSGQLHGKVTPHKYSTDVLVTDSTARLADFFGGADPAKLFGKKPMVLCRIGR